MTDLKEDQLVEREKDMLVVRDPMEDIEVVMEVPEEDMAAVEETMVAVAILEVEVISEVEAILEAEETSEVEVISEVEVEEELEDSMMKDQEVDMVEQGDIINLMMRDLTKMKVDMVEEDLMIMKMKDLQEVEKKKVAMAAAEDTMILMLKDLLEVVISLDLVEDHQEKISIDHIEEVLVKEVAMVKEDLSKEEVIEDSEEVLHPPEEKEE